MFLHGEISELEPFIVSLSYGKTKFSSLWQGSLSSLTEQTATAGRKQRFQLSYTQSLVLHFSVAQSNSSRELVMRSFILPIPACIFCPAFPFASFSPQGLPLGHPESPEKSGLLPFLLLVSPLCWVSQGLRTDSQG